jgi:hypothetical protein
MRKNAVLIFAAMLLALSTRAQTPVIITVNTKAHGAPVPDDFAGLSFGMKALLPDKAGNHLFSPANAPLITLFRNIGLRHLRMGGTTVESPVQTPIPGTAEIDDLFAFAKAAGVNKIIYSLRLLENDPAVSHIPTNAAIARYITAHYAPQLQAFSIGNEPDRGQIFKQDYTISNFSTYLGQWRKFAAAITEAVPGARFSGPDCGSGEVKWTTRFARAEAKSGLLESISEHFYAGGKGKGLEAADAIASMLSPEWNEANQKLYNEAAAPVMSNKLSYRFTEANDHYSGGVADASDTFAGALWALDFLHWWAAHGALGVDFHNTQWVPSDVIRPGPDHLPAINPKAYGLKAFDIGGHGVPLPVNMANSAGVNLTAYAMRDGTNLFVTVINKEYGPKARMADLTIASDGFSGTAWQMALTAHNNDVTSKTGITFGGGTIGNDKLSKDRWQAIDVHHAISIAPATALVIKISD